MWKVGLTLKIWLVLLNCAFDVDERENFLRHRVRRFPARVLLALRVRVNATWGDKIARIFEVRASDAMM